MTITAGRAERGRDEQDTSAPAARPTRASRARELATILVPALIAYVPLLLTKPGIVGADTKTYLYLDPVKLLRAAPYVWDHQIGLGTVTHQNIGYLFPMGPFYLFFQGIGVPDWVAQRLWLASVMFAAAMGVRYLLRTLGRTPVVGEQDPVDGQVERRAWLGVGPLGVLVASLGYMLSPYLLDYSARISVILLPWAALPWLIALAAKSLRHGGWKYPAWFAFVVLAVGGINATALIMVGLGPLLWVAHATWVDREVTGKQALAACGRMGALTLLTSLWWMAGLWAEGRYGLPVIRYTESYRTVAEVSNAPEVLRGLGYWFFYGDDKLGPWIEPSADFTTRWWLLGLSYLLPILALLGAALVRWRYRAYFIGLILFGGLTAVAAYPWKASSFTGSIFKAFTRTDAGLSLRSTPRAVPLVILGTAVFLGASIDALGRRLPKYSVALAAVACGLVMANMPPMFNNTMVASNLERDEEVPSYWLDDAAYLQSRGEDTRVLEIPGADFASYRWGNTVDPILPGLMDRQYVARELFTWGSPPSANLINALDRRFHEETMDPEALVPIAKLMGVGDINVRSDMQYERYRIARPRALWDLIRRTPGLGDPARFGPDDPPNVAGPQQTMVDEVELGTPMGLEEPPRVAAFPVEGALPTVRAVTAERPLLMAADGEGLVDAASQGLIDPEQAIFYSASLAKDQAAFDRIYGSGADLLVTDSNRKRARRWGALRENTGYTERAGETPLEFDPTDQRLDVFPGATDDAYTVTQQGAKQGASNGAVATSVNYGNPITYTPDDRAANAIDGDPLTAWRVGAITSVQNEKLFIATQHPVTTDHVNLLQPINLERTRWITKARLTFEGGEEGGSGTSSIDVELTDASRAETAEGQDVTFPSRTFDRLTIEVLATNLGEQAVFDGVSGVGFAEVRIPGVDSQELVRTPVDLLAEAGPSSLDHRLTFLFTRLRSNPAEPVRTDEEVAIRRLVTLPTARSFGVEGTARLSAYLPDDRIDAVLGLPDAEHGGVTAKADVHLPGNLRQRASAAIDGDESTAWTSIYQKQTGHWLEYTNAEPLAFDHLDLAILADGRHSLPTKLRLDVDGQDQGTIDIPAIIPSTEVGHTEHVRVPLPHPVTGKTMRFTIEDVQKVETQEWYSSGFTTLPVSIAELGVPGLHLAPAGARFDTGCRTNLLAVDDEPVPVRIQGATADALDKKALPIEPCGDEPGVTLAAGDHIVRTGIGRDVGVDVDLDRLALASEVGGAARADAKASDVPAPPASTFDENGPVRAQLTVPSADQPFWAVLGQSWNPGWTASVNGTPLGAPVPINGYANGWYVDPAVVGSGPLVITMTWTPQRLVWIFIGISVLTVLLCLALMFFGGRRPRAARVLDAEPDRPLAPTFEAPWPWSRAGSSERAPPDAVVPVRAAVLCAVGSGFFVAVVTPEMYLMPLLGLPFGAAVYVALRRRGARSWLGLAAAGSLALAAAYISIQQRRNHYKPNFVWPTQFNRVHILGLMAMLLLGAEALRELAVRRRNRADAAAADAGADGVADVPSSDPPAPSSTRSTP